jgi:O-antigen/teichoic acid export membrane protein
VLQTSDHIAVDNAILIAGEVIWSGLSLMWLPTMTHRAATVVPVAVAFTAASAFVWIARLICSTNWRHPQPAFLAARAKVVFGLLGFGSFVLVSQLSDFLYAPTDMILINRLLTPEDLAAYAPAIQIDAGLLLLMTGLAAVLLPKAALAHAAGDRAAVKMYYIKGTVLGGGLLAVIAFLAWACSASWLRWWLGHPLHDTRVVLPLVLVNTVVGGSSAVGRSILLGMGKVRVFSIAVILAGVTNVLCSYAFVKYWHLGLKGIILGTLVAVIVRCGVWMPWYVMRVLGKAAPIDMELAETGDIPGAV